MSNTKVNMHPRVIYVNRAQLLLRPTNIEELISEDHPARAIWDFTGKLDLSRYYDKIKSVAGEAGRPVYDPRMLIAIWLYAYSVGIGSAREIARRCTTDSAFQWLCGYLEISYHTLSDFRVNDMEDLDEIFTNSLALLSVDGLITMKTVGIDGTKIKANAGADTYRREAKIKECLFAAENQVKELSKQEKETKGTEKQKSARKRALKERQEILETAAEEFRKLRKEQAEKARVKNKKEARVSTTDPESRIMKQSDGGFAPSYNVELATDASAEIIVGIGVTQRGDDYDAAIPTIEDVKRRTKEYPEECMVDGGFVSNKNIMEMEDRGIEFISGAHKESPKKMQRQFEKRGVTEDFYPDKFSYNRNENIITCPAGEILTSNGKERKEGVTRYKYRAQSEICGKCKNKGQCCPKTKGGRAVFRKEYDKAVVEFRSKMETAEMKAKYKKRGALCEFPNACLKAKFKLRQFNVRGLAKVTMEAIWACFTHNIKRWISLRWMPAIQAA